MLIIYKYTYIYPLSRFLAFLEQKHIFKKESKNKWNHIIKKKEPKKE